MDNSKSLLTAQYNNIYTVPNNLASIRGSGKFQPMPSNWVTGMEPTYTAEFPSSRGGSVSMSTLEQAPVGTRVNNKWNFGSDEDSTKFNLKGDPYTTAGLSITNETPTSLNTLFFNKKNVEYLSKRIVDDVYKITGIKIRPQDENSLMVIMQNKYIYANEGWLPTTSVVHLAVARTDNAPCSIRDRLSRLNQAVLQDAIQQVLSGIRMYQQYYKDASSMPMPLDHPTVMTQKGSRVLQENIGFTSGNSPGIASYNMRNNIIE